MRAQKQSLWALAIALVGLTSLARAQEERPRLMAETATFTDVLDAFDDQDPFDLAVFVGFEHTTLAGTVQRERNDAAAGDARGSANLDDVAEYQHSTNVLDLGLGLGVAPDLMLYTGVPLVLSDDRSLALPSGVSRGVAEERAGQLFNIPFAAETRSGIPWVKLGLAWAILNQQRVWEYPTWVLRVEGRFGVGDALNACRDDGTCNPASSTNGVSPGTNALRFDTRMSRRYSYLEPYTALGFQIGFPAGAERTFKPGGDLGGFMNTLPPIIGEITAGAEIIPWEDRGSWQRFSIDLRVVASYLSEGHDFSPLFDALGTSNDPQLTTPNKEGPFEGARDVAFTGMTDTQSRARFVTSMALRMRAARYVTFEFGGKLGFQQGYMISYTDACNPNFSASADDSRRGSCRQGIINPHHRPVIDLPGQRFRLDDALIYGIFANATAQF